MKMITMRTGLFGLGASVAGLALTASLAFASNDLPFKITVDGETVTRSTLPALEEAQEATQVDVTFDGLGVTPTLNVSTVPMQAGFEAGDTIRFLGSFNYGAWVDRGEIRIYERGKQRDSDVFRVLDLSDEGVAEWVMPSGGASEFVYVLRVYDAEGRFDETHALPLNRIGSTIADEEHGRDAIAPGYAEDRTAVRNIDVHGGTITVTGSNIPDDHEVFVMGEPVPVDADGKFVVKRLMPSGLHDVKINVTKDGEGLDFSRSVEIPESEWFSVGLADFTVGYNLKDHIEALRPGEFDDDVYTRGRLAFYLKGKIKGRYILTAAADTGDQKLKSIFKGLDGKEPREFLKRLDPDDYYPVYGDDSVSVEDAPTRGKFYVRFEKGPSHVMWGNFKADITGSKFIRNERALYGAKAAWRSDTPSPEGEATTKLDAHAALPGTVANRDTFRGTGGSGYFLKHQDITPGTETVAIEVRNTITGWVISRQILKFGVDYDFDYVQGVIILRKPLPSSSALGTENYLVVSYEYAPAARDVNGYSIGGRAQQWLGPHVRVGITGLTEKSGEANQKVAGADIHLRHSDKTYLDAEVAKSRGPGFGFTYSADGGLTNQVNPSAGVVDKKALAYRVEGQVALEDVTDGKAEGKIVARLEEYQKGFSSLDVEANDRRRVWGVEGDVKLSDSVKAAGTYSEEKVFTSSINRQAYAKIQARISDEVAVEPYAAYTEKQSTTLGATDNGTRADAGVKVLYSWNDGEEAYVFGQATVKRRGDLLKNHRAGVGGKFKFTEHVSGEGEVSHGSQGFGAKATLGYEPTAEHRYYIGYQLDPARSLATSWPFQLVGEDIGTIVVGAKHRFNEQWSAYAEENIDVFGERLSLTQVYGVTYTPDAAWSFTGGLEWGQVFDNTVNPTTLVKNPDFDRRAVSLAIGYKSDDGYEARLKGEFRTDESEDPTKDMQAYLIQSSFGAKVSDDWRAIASFDGVFTEASDSTREGDYAEASIGFAYRPTESDRLNALFKYTLLLDEPGGNQVSVDGTTSSPAQRSAIFSGDVSYDLLPQLTIGAKYGFRYGQTRERVAGAPWVNSQAHLGIIRADIHFVHAWDLLLEGRYLWSPSSDDSDLGALAAVYRHFGDNMKVGIGYNFGQFSDDLRDLSHNDHGVFLNVIGKF